VICPLYVIKPSRLRLPSSWFSVWTWDWQP